MSALVGLLWSLAVVAVAGAGAAAIVGLRPLRDRLFGAAIVLIVAALVLPPIMNVIARAVSIVTARPVDGPASSRLAAGGFILGHVALAAYLIRRRHGAGRDDALLAARGRVRPRLSPEGSGAREVEEGP